MPYVYHPKKTRERFARARLRIAASLKKDPVESNRSISRRTGSHHATVASVRKILEAANEIPVVTKRKGRDGRVWGRPPRWVVYGLEDAISINTEVLIAVEDLVCVLRDHLRDELRLLGQIRNGEYDPEQLAEPRNGRSRKPWEEGVIARRERTSGFLDRSRE